MLFIAYVQNCIVYTLTTGHIVTVRNIVMASQKCAVQAI